MPIRSINDLRKQVGPDWDKVSDEDLISSYAQSIEADPAAVARELGFGLEEGGRNSKRLSSAVDRYQAGLLGFGEEIAKGVGADRVSGFLGERRRANELRADTDALRARNLGAIDSYKDVDSLSDFGNYAVGLGIQSLPYLGEAVAGGIAGRAVMGGTRAALGAANAAGDVAAASKAKRALNIGSSAGAAVASYPSAVGDVLSSQREQADVTDPGSAFALGVPYALANVVGLEGAAARATLFRNSVDMLDKVGGVKGAVARTAATGATVGAKESASEVFQEGMNQLGRMAVDPTEQFFSEAAQDRFKESAVGGFVLGGGIASAAGGWRRSESLLPGATPPANTQTTGGGDVGQVFTQTNTGTTPINTTQLDPSTVAPPASTTPAMGGTSDIAQATQAAQQEEQRVQQQLEQQAAREQVFEQYGIADPTNPSRGQFFGNKLFGPVVNQVADAMIKADSQLTPVLRDLTRAVAIANAETGNQLVRVPFNANKPDQTVAKAMEAINGVLTKFQIGHVQSVDEAAQILNELSGNAKGKQLEQINAMHFALTGEDTTGYLESQGATKGAKDGQLQVQTTPGVGGVSAQGGSPEAGTGVAGDVRPSQVQPVNAGSVPAGSLGLQTGQVPGSGVRGAGPADDVRPSSGDGQAQAPQVTQGVQGGQTQAAPTAPATQGSGVQPEVPGAQTDGLRQAGTDAGTAPQAQEVTDPESLSQTVESITQEVMRLMIPPTSRMNEQTAIKQRDFVFMLLTEGPYGTLEVMAKDAGIKPSQAKDWSAKAKAMKEDPEFEQKLRGAYELVAKQRGLTIAQLLEGVKQKANEPVAGPEIVNDADTEADGSQGTTRTEEVLESDEQEFDIPSEEEAAKGNSDREVTDEGLSIKGRKSGESLQERYNAVETNQAKYLRLTKQLEAAENKGDEAEVERINAEIEKVLAKGVEQAEKRSKKTKSEDKPAAPVAKREPDSAELAAAAQRFKEVKGDLTKLTDAELAAVKARAQKFNNDELVAKVDAEVLRRAQLVQAGEQWSAYADPNTQGKWADLTPEQQEKWRVAVIDDRNPSSDLVDEIVTKAEKPAPKAEKPAPKVEKPVAKAEPKKEAPAEKPAETTKEKYAKLVAGIPGAPEFDSLPKDQQDQITDLANRDQLDLAAVNRIVAAEQTSTVTEPEAEVLTEAIDGLTEPQINRLEKHYGETRDSDQFMARVREDVVKYINKGAEAVAGAIRSIIKTISEGVLAIGVIFNPNANLDNFSFDLRGAYAQTIDVRATVPAAAEAKMSDLAKSVYERMAPVAEKSGKAFIIADKPNGMIHAFNADGSVIVQDTALYGKDMGDTLGASSLEGGPKITPAGKFTLRISPVGDAYVGGYTLDLKESYDGTGYIAIHAAYTGNRAENRPGRLASPTAADNRISYGCINTSHDTFLKSFLPNIDKFNGGLALVLPDNQALADAMFQGETKTVERGGSRAGDSNTRTVAAKEEQGAPTIRRMERQDTKADGIQWEDAPEWREREGGRVVDIVVNGKVQQSFELVPPGLWNAFKGDAQQNLLRNPEPQRKRGEAAEAWSNTLFKYKERGPINGVERTVLVTLESGDLEAIERRARSVDYTQLRPSIVAMLSHAAFKQGQVLDVDTVAAFSNLDATSKKNLERLAPDWLLGKAERPTEPLGEMPRTGPAPKMRQRMDRGDTVDVNTGTLKFTGSVVDEQSLRRNPGVDEALRHYERIGMRSLIDAVDVWMVASPDADFDAAIMDLNGRQVLAVRVSILTDQTRSAWSVHHELGHIADDTFAQNGVFSGEGEFNLRVKGTGANAEIQAFGSVAKEVQGFVKANPDHPFSKMMGYPLDRKKKSSQNLTADEVRMEMFAQLWALYSSPEGQDFLTDNLPTTAQFMEAAYEVIKSENSAAQGSNAQTQIGQRQQAPQNNRGATGLTGAVRPEEVRLLKSPPNAVIGRMPKPLQEPTRTIWTSLFKAGQKGVLSLAITEDVVNMAKKYMASAADYLKAQYDQQATRLEFELGVEKIIQAYDNLPKNLQGTGEGSVNKFIYDSTVKGLWGFAPSYNFNVKVDPEMKKRFDAMPADAQKVIRDTLEHGYKALKAKQDAVLAAAEKEFKQREDAAQGDVIELADIALERSAFTAKYDRMLKIKTDKPYAYLGRYGDYVAVAKSQEFLDAENLIEKGDLDAAKWMAENQSNPDHYVVSFAETQAEADKMAADWKASGQYAATYGAEKLDGSAYTGGGDLFLAFTRMQNMITRKAKNEIMDSEVTDAMRKLVSDLYLTTVAEASAHAPNMQRKNIAGADMDMMRNLATRGRADAHFLSTLKHGEEVANATDRMIDERKSNPREATPLLNELLKRQALSLEYRVPSTLAQNLTQFSTVWYLSTNPAFYAQQLLQTTVLSLPFMAGRLGYFRSARAINQAYKDVGGMVKGLGINDHVDYDKAPADVRDMLKKLVGMGKIDVGIDAEAKARAGDQGVIDKVMLKLQGVNTRVETINRSVAAVAAYRGYLQKYGADKTDAATQYAADVVSNTHGSYDGFNTPRLLASDIGRVVGQFRRFQIIMLSMLAKTIHGAFKGASAEERAVARASLRFITAHMAVLGGGLGIPFVNQMGNILLSIFGDDEEPKDLEQYLRKVIDNEVVADLLLNGVPSMVGLESLGKKVAMDNVASLLPFTDVDLTSRAGLEKVYAALMGPTAGLTLKAADAFGLFSQGNYYRGLEMLMPTGGANVAKAIRFSSEGVTMRNGDTVMGPEEVSMVDAAFQAVGLPTTTFTDRQKAQSFVIASDKFYQDKSAQIKRDYIKAFNKGDSGAMQDAREAWFSLQDARVRNGYSRQPASALFRAPMEQARRERDAVGGVQANRANRQFVEDVTSR